MTPRTITATPVSRWRPATDVGAPDGALMALALRLADHARTAGLVVLRVWATKVTNSHSHYLRVTDRWGDAWLIRVSDHERRECSAGNERPHYDLIIRDARDGEQHARGWLDQVALGMVDWTDPTEGVRGRRLQRWNRR